ncbi:YeeE/YedE family protein [Luteimonas sp. MC1782]|uniref:YeeE/YedE family protein n=1 Tax=Luteimonas sp. MC1782 TaxID=2760305 RepID=UPI001600D83C|nr:YeeE/YedE thiosulfate transporter family protein [Luteimonas sp. MC1782]MBB1472491.1 YeeE/YedE family protein [Luteimonas sp. MC1782]
MTTTWLMALAGGVLIGLAATLLLWLNGRVAGVSGILAGVVFPRRGEVAWRVAFLAGLVLAGGASITLLPDMATPREGFSPLLLVAAGLLVGFGTSLGNGCTSGHGVCGLGRLSLRSLVAVLTFMATAVATTWVVRHAGGWA